MIRTTSLDLSKQLKEAGYPQDTEFEWYTSDYKEDDAWITNDAGEYATFGDDLIAAAPTAEEILERLPIEVKSIGFISILRFQTYWVGYGERTKKYVHKDSESLAEAAGEMWLYLKKEKLL